MLRKRRGNGSVVIYRLFLVAMIAAVIFFMMRIASGKLETDFSARSDHAFDPGAIRWEISMTVVEK